MTGDVPPLLVAEQGYNLGRLGRSADARKVLTRLNDLSGRIFVDPYFPAVVYLGLGDTERALDWLERGFTERSGFMVSLAADPKWDGVRTLPRFRDLVRRVGFL
jgi:hypothetical protein